MCADSTTGEAPAAGAVLELRSVQRTIDGVEVLRDIHWRVEPQQHWVVLGPNGSGKTTLMQIASMWLHPSSGEVAVLGQRLGHTDVRTLRSRIGFTSAALAKMLRPHIQVSDVVMTALNAALEPWWHEYRDEDRANAQRVLDRVGAGHLAQRRFGTCSDGERQRVLVARSLMTDPGLVLLDEPTAALDLTGREQFISMLNDLASDPASPPMVLVTHHVEEIPDRFTHCLLLRDGRTLAQGALSEVLTDELLSACFGLRLTIEQRNGRWTARTN
ncbi:MAG: ABC transporter ATP-binding protein [Acidimicrobiaceae bacterium]|nr:ABC transporter ATP-binding protein [Acidimicrobiaceae bacterium]MXW75990.1 ABC transporter ATP-binding protein [Acidimicrobiaceae bacterium]MYC43324.1 ABC transporter ATP-binding protein [Acidimicrobiaceae bacterium]MYD06131.1 ABC transporter ATP-binding protein [Acidimicrobiaceae bacterium]MYH87848.1 ABC transporter ATP-binding protein [Acidimicrobiaceae bacterium]